MLKWPRLGVGNWEVFEIDDMKAWLSELESKHVEFIVEITDQADLTVFPNIHFLSVRYERARLDGLR